MQIMKHGQKGNSPYMPEVYVYYETYHALRAFHHYLEVVNTVSTYHQVMVEQYRKRLEHLRLLNFRGYCRANRSYNSLMGIYQGIYDQSALCPKHRSS